MRVFWIGIGTLAGVTLLVIHLASEGCKDRWTPFNLEGVWNYETGCSVRIGGSLVREEYVSLDPRMPTRPLDSGSAKPLDPRNQALARPDWVILGPDDIRARKNER